MKKLASIAAIAVAALSLAFGAAAQQDYPNKPVRIIVPYAAGGATDILARLMAKGMSERLGQPVVIENKPGAGGGVGTALAAQAPGDGYTLLFGNLGPNAINPSIYKDLQYDAEKDFQAISNVANTPFILVVPPAVPAKTVKELIELGRREPGKHNYASVGIGSASHIASELFNVMAGTKFQHVPYKGSAPASLATMAGEVTMYMGSGPEISGHIQGGKLRALGISTEKRSPVAPEIPTISESGLPGFVVNVWFGLFAPSATPRPIIDKLNKVVVDTINSKEVTERIRQANSVPNPTTPDEFQALVKSEIVKWAKVVKESGAKAN
ncbi:MAG TPA: tripartite tricarboxylate transporter substrate binding protein [Usitatibacter sp.]|nr:tripartite tricarboxylate transporter substrate binding protein [Usitatibacter sp.]